MEKNIIIIAVGKFLLMKMLDQHYKIDALLTLFFNSKEITTEGYNAKEVQMLATTTIPISSFQSYRCKENVSINVPINVKNVSGKCERTEIAREDSWKVTAKFKFNSGPMYQVTSHTMSEKRNVERVKSGVSFNDYFPVRKILEEYRRQIDVIVKNGIASFRTGNKIFKYVDGEEDGELYCKFMIDNLKQLNTFLGPSLKNVEFKFSN